MAVICVHRQHFRKEIPTIHRHDHGDERGRVSRDSVIFRLNPYLASGVPRFGGRLGRGDFPASKKHPILLPHRSNTTQMIIRHTHRNLGHVGRNRNSRITASPPFTNYEVENIVNSRPLTSISDDADFDPLTPNHLLTAKIEPTSVLPGDCCGEDVYSRKRWKRIQYLSHLFWTRWRRRYLPLLQERQRWTRLWRHIQTDDIVLMKDNSVPRYDWLMARVVATEP